MKSTPLALLRSRPDFLLLSLVTFVSGLGATLTGVAIFRELARIHASSLIFAWAFALTILPGLGASELASRCLRRFDTAHVMVMVQLLGAVGVALPYLGTLTGQAWLLLVAMPLASATAGFLVPFVNVYTRANFKDHELLSIAEIASINLGLDFLLGSILGTLLIDRIGPHPYFAFDAVTYAAAAAAIYALCRRYPEAFAGLKGEVNPATTFRWRGLKPQQKRAFALYPILAAACSPCTALLPSAGAAFGGDVMIASFAVSPTLLLLLCKTAGQFVGPLTVRLMKLDAILQTPRLIFVFLALFLGCYAFVFTATSLALVASAVVLAHIFSNIVFTISFYAFSRHFGVEAIGPAATRQYQLAGVIMAGSSLACGALTERLPLVTAVCFGALCLAASTLILGCSPQPVTSTSSGGVDNDQAS